MVGTFDSVPESRGLLVIQGKGLACNEAHTLSLVPEKLLTVSR